MNLDPTSRARARPIMIFAALVLVTVACARREALVAPPPPCPPPRANPLPATTSGPARPLRPCSADGRVSAAMARATWAITGPEGGAMLALATEPGTSTAYAGMHGAWKTTDGRTWARASTGLSGIVSAVATHPSARGTVFAASDDGLYRSTDGAATWKLLSSLPLPRTDPVGQWVTYTTHGITAVAAAPWVTVRSPAGTLLAGTDGLGLWRSTDDGERWERAALAPATTVDAIAFDPGRPDVVYATGVQAVGSRWIGAVYRSTDGGVRWSQTTLQGQQELREVFVDPAFPDVVYAGGHGLFESRDAGATWEKVVNASVFAFAAYDKGRAHVRLASALGGVYRKTVGRGGWTMDPPESGLPAEPWARDIAVGANGVVLAATRSGVLASEAHGWCWRPASTGLHEAYVEKLGVGPAGSGIVYAATDGVQRSLDGGATWKRGAHPDETQLFTAIAVEQRHPERAWLTGGSGVYRTTDAGATWTALPGVPRARAVAIDPSDESVVYVATDTEVIRSADGFRTWTSLELPGAPAIALAVSPGSPAVLWAGTYHGFCMMDLSAATPRCRRVLGTRSTRAIAVDPGSDGATVHVAADEGLYVTRTRGERWTLLAQEARHTSLAWAGGALFASSMSRGVEVSCDGGATFEPVGTGGPTRVPSVAVVAKDGLIFASTLEGVYRATVP
jgi:photosystem II stability/assembly factor-like uncharacterized protein